MASLNLTLSESLRAFVEEKAAKEGYGTADEYIQALIRLEAEKQEARERLEALLLEGLDSGEPVEVNEEY